MNGTREKMSSLLIFAWLPWPVEGQGLLVSCLCDHPRKENSKLPAGIYNFLLCMQLSKTLLFEGLFFVFDDKKTPLSAVGTVYPPCPESQAGAKEAKRAKMVKVKAPLLGLLVGVSSGIVVVS